MPGDRHTRKARTEAHAAFDRLWRDRFLPTRAAAYRWLQGALGIDHAEAHISRFGAARCGFVVRLAEAFIARATPEASPVVDLDPWGLVPRGVDPDDLDSIDFEGVVRATAFHERARAALTPAPVAFELPDDAPAPGSVPAPVAELMTLDEEPVDLSAGEAPHFTPTTPSGSSTAGDEAPFVEPPDGW